MIRFNKVNFLVLVFQFLYLIFDNNKSFAQASFEQTEGIVKFMGGNAKAAIPILKKECARGINDSCGFLGLAFYSGNGVKKNHKLALNYIIPACDKGNSTSCELLGLYYENGEIFPKNAELALKLFEKSCEKENPMGCYMVAFSYFVNDGIKKDPIKVKYYAKKALEYDPNMEEAKDLLSMFE